uniref:Uncharacterized protein n=1 Tax=Timema tahoe TaxID=61484 RepID=A0A7R9FKU9_9NEOP|nr:unnamed protein product [Timema tahoe]
MVLDSSSCYREPSAFGACVLHSSDDNPVFKRCEKLGGSIDHDLVYIMETGHTTTFDAKRYVINVNCELPNARSPNFIAQCDINDVIVDMRIDN